MRKIENRRVNFLKTIESLFFLQKIKMKKIIREFLIRSRLGIVVGKREVEVKYLVIHTAASPASWTWQWLQSFFLNALKWTKEGYHVVIQADGFVKRFIQSNKTSNGILPYKSPNGDISISNENAENICWIGGIDKRGKPIDNRTEVQKDVLRNIVEWYLAQYPDLIVLGHNQIANKACPCFSVPKWLRSIGVSEANIYDGDNFNVLKINKY